MIIIVIPSKPTSSCCLAFYNFFMCLCNSGNDAIRKNTAKPTCIYNKIWKTSPPTCRAARSVSKAFRRLHYEMNRLHNCCRYPGCTRITNTSIQGSANRVSQQHANVKSRSINVRIPQTYLTRVTLS